LTVCSSSTGATLQVGAHCRMPAIWLLTP
jgi:hypothetical protein